MLKKRGIVLKPYEITVSDEMERGWKPNVEVYPTCPRCGSTNTKFCYYNNYSMTQPRYFCKGCRRYWTKGGSLRNIPVGGGFRKTRRAKSIRISDSVNSRNFIARGGGGGSNTGTNGCGNTECGGGGGGSSSVLPSGTTIDLAQVYANFLKQRPEMNQVHHRDQIPQALASEVDPMSSFGFSSIPNMELEFGATNFGSNLETYLSEGSGLQFYWYNSVFNNQPDERGKDYFHTSGISNYGLPPLPVEDLGWSDSNIGFSEQLLIQGIESEGQDQNDDPLIGRRKTSATFDLSTNFDSIFRP